MTVQNELYQAIVTRRSTRRYDKNRLDEVTLARVGEIVDGVKPLITGNRFEVLMRDTAPGEDLAAILGAYGRLVTPPYYLVPYLTGEAHLLVDLGYRLEQIVVRLTALGLGTCYVGALRREAEVRVHFALPDEARVGAFLAFGRPSEALGGRLVNTMLRRASGATNKLAVERIFFRESFDTPGEPPAAMAPLVEAARNAPSAFNAQPWRFLERGEDLYLFLERDNPRYGSDESTNYCLYDSGVCMSNVTLALEALGMEGRWQMLAEDDAALPACPANLRPVAKLAGATP